MKLAHIWLKVKLDRRDWVSISSPKLFPFILPSLQNKSAQIFSPQNSKSLIWVYDRECSPSSRDAGIAPNTFGQQSNFPQISLGEVPLKSYILSTQGLLPNKKETLNTWSYQKHWATCSTQRSNCIQHWTCPVLACFVVKSSVNHTERPQKAKQPCQGCAALPHFGPRIILVLICAQVGWVLFTSLPVQHKGALVQVSTSAPDLFFLMNC